MDWQTGKDLELRSGDSRRARFFREKDSFMDVDGQRFEDYLAAHTRLKAADEAVRAEGARLLDEYQTECVRILPYLQPVGGELRGPDDPAWDEASDRLPGLRTALCALIEWARKNLPRP